ncbi:3-hydroxyisobutyryl-CoA hydrolase-like protein 1, mitochondrial [Vigna unguiculata]|uniref:3-hydroxyisobutyryl-CoA hydrolase n=1 Tax=Vigna unguiculata TaxID=3917 RepID=A0A4D6MTA8_VIGUN|nr:3-hydroxyisobutyryl-CoA hydrolase-like protein 1, mitochondrial [Vigna unguiculata]QCE04706.1 3-hydroxyisobutyryl-CoA hydrolase [Vigna unguiculata]
MMQRKRVGWWFFTKAKLSLNKYRNFSSQHVILDNPNHSQVLVEGNGCSRMAILNRPSALNALNTNMLATLHKFYRSWEDNPDIGFVMMKGSGRAFAAGGDIVALYHLINKGNMEACKEFFRTAYSFMYLIGTYLKPHVALLNGITMGGGAGVSIPGTFRAATDKTIFATPEVHIGFHPDAAASFYLSHLPGHLGEYLALTGEKLNGVEMVTCGLATHYSLSARLPLIEEQLGKLVTDDPSVIEATLEHYGDLVHPDSSSVLQRIEILDKCFCHDTVEEIVDAMENAASETKDAWCIATLNRLKEAAPLSLKVALRSIREGRFQTLDQCLLREYRMTLQAIHGQISGDFCEGVRARVVDKDFAPKWDPPTLQKVSQDMVDQYFLPLSESEPDLELPTKSREAFL